MVGWDNAKNALKKFLNVLVNVYNRIDREQTIHRDPETTSRLPLNCFLVPPLLVKKHFVKRHLVNTAQTINCNVNHNNSPCCIIQRLCWHYVFWPNGKIIAVSVKHFDSLMSFGFVAFNQKMHNPILPILTLSVLTFN